MGKISNTEMCIARRLQFIKKEVDAGRREPYEARLAKLAAETDSLFESNRTKSRKAKMRLSEVEKKNKEKEYHNEYFNKNREKIIEYSRRYRESNGEILRAKARLKYKLKKTIKDANKVIEKDKD